MQIQKLKIRKPKGDPLSIFRNFFDFFRFFRIFSIFSCLTNKLICWIRGVCLIKEITYSARVFYKICQAIFYLKTANLAINTANSMASGIYRLIRKTKLKLAIKNIGKLIGCH